MQSVSVILPNYCPDDEVRGYMLRFLETYKKTVPKGSVQFIVVENGSYSPELEEVADIYIHKPKPIGYARAVNLGLALADGERVFVMNNDLELPDGWLETMLAEYEAGAKGVLSPMDMEAEPIRYMDAHWYSLWLTDTSVLKKVGYLDEYLNYRYHDQDYSIRVKKAGFEVMRTGKVRVKHVNSATYNKMPERKYEGFEHDEMIRRYGVALFNQWIHENRGTDTSI